MALRTSMCIVYRVSCIVYCVLCIVYVNKGMNQSINRPKQCFYFLFVHRFFISRSTIFSTPNPTSSAGALNPQVKTVDRPFMTRRFRKCLRHVIYGTMEIVKKEENKERTLFHLFCNHTFNIISVRPKNKDFLHV